LDRRDLLLLAVIGVAVLALQSWIALGLAATGVFEQFDVFFDTDPVYWQSAFAQGWEDGDFYHPLLAYYFSVPIHVVARVAAWGGVEDLPGLRQVLALHVAPLATALKAVCFYLVFRKLQLDRVPAFLAAALGALGFSSVLFGSIPESYPVTGMAMALVALAAVSWGGRFGLRQLAGALCVATFTAGITASNIIYCGWSLWSSMAQRTGAIRAIWRAAVLCAVALVIALLVGMAIERFRSADDGGASTTQSQAPLFMKFTNSPAAMLENAVGFPAMVARSFLPSAPRITANPLAERTVGRYRQQFTYNGMSGWLQLSGGLLAILVLAGGAVIAWKAGGAWRLVAMSSVPSILSYWALYSYFGSNTYLYSQVWYVPSLLLAGAWFTLPVLRSRLAAVLMALVLGGLLAADLAAITSIRESLVAAG
jgi:hypothetical protein